MYFGYFVIISPWKRAVPFIWTNLNPFTQRCFVPSLVEIAPGVSGEGDFLISSVYYHHFVIISPWKKARPLIWINLNPLHPGILCVKFGWNWPNGSGEEDEIVKSLQTDGRTDERTDGKTDDGRQVIRKAHLNFQLRWAKNNFDQTENADALDLVRPCVHPYLGPLWRCPYSLAVFIGAFALSGGNLAPTLTWQRVIHHLLIHQTFHFSSYYRNFVSHAFQGRTLKIKKLTDGKTCRSFFF